MTTALIGILACLPFGGSATKYSVEAPAGSTVAIRVGEYDRPFVWSHGGGYDAATDTVAWFSSPEDRVLEVTVDGPGDPDAEARVYLDDGTVVAAKCGSR